MWRVKERLQGVVHVLRWREREKEATSPVGQHGEIIDEQHQTSAQVAQGESDWSALICWRISRWGIHEQLIFSDEGGLTHPSTHPAEPESTPAAFRWGRGYTLLEKSLVHCWTSTQNFLLWWFSHGTWRRNGSERIAGCGWSTQLSLFISGWEVSFPLCEVTKSRIPWCFSANSTVEQIQYLVFLRTSFSDKRHEELLIVFFLKLGEFCIKCDH